jgi:hypothetical protein
MISLSLTIGSNRRLCNKIYNYYRIPGIQPATRYCGSRLNWFLFDSGYASKLCAYAESDGFAGPIFPLQTFTKKIADTTYCGPPFFQDLRYLDISQYKTMHLNAVFNTQNLICSL